MLYPSDFLCSLPWSVSVSTELPQECVNGLGLNRIPFLSSSCMVQYLIENLLLSQYSHFTPYALSPHLHGNHTRHSSESRRSCVCACLHACQCVHSCLHWLKHWELCNWIAVYGKVGLGNEEWEETVGGRNSVVTSYFSVSVLTHMVHSCICSMYALTHFLRKKEIKTENPLTSITLQPWQSRVPVIRLFVYIISKWNLEVTIKIQGICFFTLIYALKNYYRENAH